MKFFEKLMTSARDSWDTRQRERQRERRERRRRRRRRRGGKVAVIGSGLGGLTAAWELQRLGHDVTVFDGGSDGFLWGNSNNYLISSLLRQLDLPSRASRFFAKETAPVCVCEGPKRFARIPESFQDVISSRLLSPAAKIRYFAEPFVFPLNEWVLRLAGKGEGYTHYERSLGDFGTQHFGKEYADAVFSQREVERSAMWLTAGAKPPREFAAVSIAPDFWDIERRRGSLLIGKFLDSIQFLSFGKNFQASAFKYQSVHAPQEVERQVAPPRIHHHYTLMSFTESMQRLTDTLREKIGEDRFKLYTKVESIERCIQEAKDEWKIRYRRNTPRLFGGLEQETFDSVVFAGPLNRLGSEILILEDGKKSNTSWLPQMKYSKVSALVLGYEDLSSLKASFGKLVVPFKNEKAVFSSIIQNSKMFPKSEKREKHSKSSTSSLTVFLREDMIKGIQEPEMLEMVLDDLEEILGITESPDACQYVQWNDCLPMHGCPDASRNRAAFEALEEIPGLFLLGCGTSGWIDDMVTKALIAAAKADKFYCDWWIESEKLARASKQGNLMLLDGILQCRRKVRKACALRQHQWNIWGTEESEMLHSPWAEVEDLSSLPLQASVQLLMHHLGLSKDLPVELTEARKAKPKPKAPEYFEAQRLVKAQVDRELIKEKILMRSERINTIAEIRAETLRLRSKASGS